MARRPAEILQLNIGLYCNQACNHCHVESSPERSESMSGAVVDKCLDLLAKTPSVGGGGGGGGGAAEGREGGGRPRRWCARIGAGGGSWAEAEGLEAE